MPNLRRLVVTVVDLLPVPLDWRDMFDGQQWERTLSMNTPHLDVFDILLMTDELSLVSNPYAALNSFDGFSKMYPDWYVAIHRQLSMDHAQSRSRQKRVY